jgi:hypothetical protein
MQIKIFSLIFLVAVSVHAMAQKRVFKSPNDFQNVGGVLNLKSGKKLEGTLSLDYTKLHEEITYKPDEGREKTFAAEDILSFELSDRVYVRKDLDTSGTGIRHTSRFCLRISETYSKLVLYQYDYLPADLANPPKTPLPANMLSKMYFVQVPKIDAKKILGIFHKKLVPGFDIKMATALKDLLPLATRIGMKDKGYFYDEKTPVPAVIKIWKTIVEEYNASN